MSYNFLVWMDNHRQFGWGLLIGSFTWLITNTPQVSDDMQLNIFFILGFIGCLFAFNGSDEILKERKHGVDKQNS